MQNMSSEDLSKLVKFSKLRIIKNLTVISCSFLLLFIGFDALSELQSTVNKEKGVGTLSQALAYIFFGISALLLPKYVIQKIGCKYSIVLSELFYIPWIASNFYPHWGTLLPSAVLKGLAASTLWSGQCTYFNKVSELYCSQLDSAKEKPKSSFQDSTKSNVTLEPLSVRNSVSLCEPPLNKTDYGSVLDGSGANHFDSVSYESGTFSNISLALEHESVESINNTNSPVEPSKHEILESINNTNSPVEPSKREILDSLANHESVNALFFGCHNMVYRSAEIWGNLLSYFILSHEGGALVADVSSCSCGADFCNYRESRCLAQNIGGVTDERRYLLIGVCVFLAVSAFLLLIFGLDQIEDSKKPVSFSTDMVLATWNHCKKKEQMLLSPLTMLQGLAQGFYIADFTKAYVGCAWGTYHIGLVSMWYGASLALASSLSGWLVKHIGRIPVFSMGIATTLGTCILLLTWSPNASQSYVFYLVAVLWGVMIGTMWSQLPAFYGVLFKEDQEAAFASLYVWLSMGYTISYVYSIYLCSYIKIYILMFVGTLGFLGYLITEKMFALKKSEISDQTEVK